MKKFKVILKFGEYECYVQAKNKDDAKIQALASHYTSLHGGITGWWMGMSRDARVEELKELNHSLTQ